MENLKDYTELLDPLFKFVGIVVAIYIAPIKKDIGKMSEEMSDVKDSVGKLNTSVEVMLVKHDLKEEQIKQLQKESGQIRQRLHDLTTNHIVKIQLNSQKIEELEKVKNGV